jgi:hypothetical protein
VPGAWRRSKLPPFAGRRWAADNGAFSHFDANAFLELLEKLRGREGGLFVAAPDVVGSAALTLERFETWQPIITSFGLPVALVAQDGLVLEEVPWDDLEAIFIGGTTAFKLGSSARSLAGYAKARGKWVHMGRVNTKKRFRYAAQIGCDSVDGSRFSKWPRKAIPLALAWMQSHDDQHELSFELKPQ